MNIVKYHAIHKYYQDDTTVFERFNAYSVVNNGTWLVRVNGLLLLPSDRWQWKPQIDGFYEQEIKITFIKDLSTDLNVLNNIRLVQGKSLFTEKIIRQTNV